MSAASDIAVQPRRRAASRGLMVFLRLVQVFIALSAIAFILIGLVFVIDNPVRAEFMEELGSEALLRRVGLTVFIGAAIAAAWYYVVELLIRVVRTVQNGDPFVEANIGRLRAMWIVVALTEVFRLVVHAGANVAVNATSVTEAETGVDIRLSTIFLVVIIAALSEAFRLGVELRRDAELTI